ncbi:hypothetical protein Tco_1344058 [Tanacetum coccineum]
MENSIIRPKAHESQYLNSIESVEPLSSKTYWGATTQRDTESYYPKDTGEANYPKNTWELLTKEDWHVLWKMEVLMGYEGFKKLIMVSKEGLKIKSFKANIVAMQGGDEEA